MGLADSINISCKIKLIMALSKEKGMAKKLVLKITC